MQVVYCKIQLTVDKFSFSIIMKIEIIIRKFVRVRKNVR